MISEITQHELDLHALWLANNPDGARLITSIGLIKVSANLSGADLSRADLSGANLSGANLSHADLSHADLSGANLSRANLSGADLSVANLSRADLSHADLSGANLAYADLSHADLSGANLAYANLYGADMHSANMTDANLACANIKDTNLVGADLTCADLSHTDLTRAYLTCAILSGVKNIPDIVIAQTSILPDEGDVVGWKKLRNGVIAKLRIPDGTKRSNATGRKCRAERAIVLDLLKDGEHIESGVSLFDSTFIYRVGETVMPREPFCEDRWQECESGIHFFITRAEAEAWDE